MKINQILTRISFTAVSFLTIFLPKISSAEVNPPVSSGIQNPLAVNGSSIMSIPDAVMALLNFVIRVGAVVAIFAFIYSGYLFVKARGNPGEIKNAKTVFYNIVIGVAVLLGAQLIASIIVGTINNIRK